MTKIKTLAFSGLRPHKLPWGYNEDHPACRSLILDIRARLAGLIEDENVRYFVTGMALGADQICAAIVLDLKSRYPDIMLEAAVPCRNQDFKWPRPSREHYREILALCDDIYVVCEEYSYDCFERRNSYMIDKCDILLAAWDGRPGGTCNTVGLAKNSNKRIIVIDPYNFVH